MVSDGINITISASQIKERGYKSILNDFLYSDGEKAFYHYKLALKPKKEFIWVYFVIGNKVRFRARFLEFIENQELDFIDGRSVYAKLWMVCYGFEKMPLPLEEKKGFQGFRYTKY